MATIEFVWDSREIEVWKGRRTEVAVVKALRMAGGDAIRAVRAATKRGIRERTRIRAGYLADKALPLTFPGGSSRAVRIDQLAWRMDVSGKAVPLGEFPRRQTRKGVSVEVARGQRKIIQSAFLARTRSGRQSVFLRPTKDRYPMGHRLGLSVADAMADGRVPGAALERARVVFSSAFGRLLPIELGKIK